MFQLESEVFSLILLVLLVLQFFEKLLFSLVYEELILDVLVVNTLLGVDPVQLSSFLLLLVSLGLRSE